MKALLVGVALLALTGPAAYAQSGSQEVPPPEMEGPGQYRVFFAFDRANLSDADRQIIIQAAEDYRRTGTARITATGHTDTSGSAAYNLELSQRRAEAVASELVRQGVPATDIVTIGRGEEDLLVPTADGVREPRNRRVEIVIPQPPPAAPAPPRSPKRRRRCLSRLPKTRSVHLALGPVYGHNFGETDKDSGGKTENDLVGAELTFRALPGFLGGVSLKQMGLWSFNGIDDGLTGRSVASLDFAPDFGIFRPTWPSTAAACTARAFRTGSSRARSSGLISRRWAGSTSASWRPMTISSATPAGTRAFSGPAWTSASGSEPAAGGGRPTAKRGPLLLLTQERSPVAGACGGSRRRGRLNPGEAVETALEAIYNAAEASAVLLAGDEPSNPRSDLDARGHNQNKPTAHDWARRFGGKNVPIGS